MLSGGRLSQRSQTWQRVAAISGAAGTTLLKNKHTGTCLSSDTTNHRAVDFSDRCLNCSTSPACTQCVGAIERVTRCNAQERSLPRCALQARTAALRVCAGSFYRGEECQECVLLHELSFKLAGCTELQLVAMGNVAPQRTVPIY